MTDNAQHAFKPGVRVHKVDTSRYNGELLGVRSGKVHKVYKNGNFTIHWDNEDKPNLDQWRAFADRGYGHRPDLWHAVRAGDHWGSGRVDLATEEVQKRVDALRRFQGVRSRLKKIQEKVAALSLHQCADDSAIHDMLGIVSALEGVIDGKKQPKESK